ncbi:CAF1 family ribonuclease (macronuclear) [Tetrahymena thermophila SB210]|uniref:poly(A)-specific ribonuclease n=1 Tax=Tetrahymena thermophila (strain SB210) TaxID=312017 RepID=I7MHV9_TETTS|nr:CAF1 family ribonuclease [Tetrahymena thermophila SB210]EAS03653.2 CAF1 family ribonuclease [Tetrahymena thermophila SB210]|eukprot:XP_001023898.2 CAF1 family ribonuclease [Tetrahymena thermophila SB210]
MSQQGTRKKLKLKEVKTTQIIDVWQDNFEKELCEIIKLIEEYKIIALDTEFPGIQQLPYKVSHEKDFEFKLIRESVKNSKIIQIGISLANEDGEVPADRPFTWQFNFNFDEENDQIKQESLDLLKNAGIDFKELKKRGISREQFSDLVSESDIILNEELTWIVFHGGFDFAYLLQMLYGSPIPDSSSSFYNLLKSFFPNVYDVKYLIKDLQYMKDSGLNKVAQELKVDRIGPQHQAGSDSLLTLGVFFKLRDDVLQQKMKKSINVIYGIGEGFIVSKTKDYLQHYKLKYHQQYQDMDYTHQNFMNQQMPNMTDYFEQMFTNMNPFQQFSAHKIIQNLSNHQNNMQMGYYSPFFNIMQQQAELNMMQGHKNMDAIYKKKYSSAKM